MCHGAKEIGRAEIDPDHPGCSEDLRLPGRGYAPARSPALHRRRRDRPAGGREGARKRPYATESLEYIT
jgi:hypothetical protein